MAASATAASACGTAVANAEARSQTRSPGSTPATRRRSTRRCWPRTARPDLGRLGANAVLAVSVACALAAADATGEPLYRLLAAGQAPLLPLPMVNILSGGAHAACSLDVQDFLAVPVGADSFAQAIEWAWRVRRATAELAAERGLVAALIADEGGLGPVLASNREALDLLALGIERARLSPGEDIAIAVDVAATQLIEPSGTYRLEAERRSLSVDELVEELAGWCRRRIRSSRIEDPLAEDDWEGWRTATRGSAGVQLLGDDLFATSLDRLERGIASRWPTPCSLSRTRSARCPLRARSSTAPTTRATPQFSRHGRARPRTRWLADLAVGWRTGQIKVGSTMRSERTAKWNRLLRIEAELRSEIAYAGRAALAPLSTA